MATNHEVRWSIPEGETRSSIQTVIPASTRVPWGVDAVGAANLSPIQGTPKTRVAVLDTGVDGAHPDLQSVVVRRYDFTNSRSGPEDVNGHGTHVAGIIAASRGNYEGVIGVSPDVEIYSYKVLDDHGSGTDSQIVAGMEKAIADGCDLFNFSLGGPTPMPRLQSLIQEMRRAGRLSVCASGNGGPIQRDAIYPARSIHAICVGSFDRSGKLSSFSQQSQTMTCFAPGGNIESTYPGERYTTMSGTSMAAPHVTGCLARIYSVFSFQHGRDPSEKEIMSIFNQWLIRDHNYPEKRFAGGGRPFIDDSKIPKPESPNPDEPKPVRVEISLRGLNDELDAAFARAGITAGNISFVIRR